MDPVELEMSDDESLAEGIARIVKDSRELALNEAAIRHAFALRARVRIVKSFDMSEGTAMDYIESLADEWLADE